MNGAQASLKSYMTIKLGVTSLDLVMQVILYLKEQILLPHFEHLLPNPDVPVTCKRLKSSQLALLARICV